MSESEQPLPSSARVGRPRGAKRDTQGRVFRAATELFSKNGYHATGVAEIGDRARVQRGALYHHIGSKEQLLFDLLKRHVELTLVGVERIALSGLPPEEKLRQLIHHQVGVMASHRREIAIYLRDVHALTGTWAKQLLELRRRVERGWSSVLAEGARLGVFRTDDHVIVNGILGTVNLVHLWYRPDGPLTPDDIAERYCTLLLDGLRPRLTPRTKPARSTKKRAGS